MAIMSVIVSTQWCIRWQPCQLLSQNNGVLDGNHVGPLPNTPLSQHNGVLDGNHVGYCLNTMVY